MARTREQRKLGQQFWIVGECRCLSLLLRFALHAPCDLRHSSVETQSIVVLDFGAQYSQLIARRIRELKIFSVVLPFNASLKEIRSYSPVGIILSGGPSSVYDKDAPLADKSVFDLGIP